jgi:hypothetical protein
VSIILQKTTACRENLYICPFFVGHFPLARKSHKIKPIHRTGLPKHSLSEATELLNLHPYTRTVAHKPCYKIEKHEFCELVSSWRVCYKTTPRTHSLWRRNLASSRWIREISEYKVMVCKKSHVYSRSVITWRWGWHVVCYKCNYYYLNSFRNTTFTLTLHSDNVLWTSVQLRDKLRLFFSRTVQQLTPMRTNSRCSLERILGDKLISMGLWPPRSTDLNPCSFYERGMQNEEVCGNNPKNEANTKKVVQDAVSSMSPA